MRVVQSNTTFGAREFVSQRLNNRHLERKPASTGAKFVYQNLGGPKDKMPKEYLADCRKAAAAVGSQKDTIILQSLPPVSKIRIISTEKQPLAVLPSIVHSLNLVANIGGNLTSNRVALSDGPLGLRAKTLAVKAQKAIAKLGK